MRDRPARWLPLTALRAHFLAGLDRRDPVTGLCDAPDVLDLYQLITGNPVLANGLPALRRRDTALLAEALGDTTDAGPLPARLAAAQIAATHHLLAEDNANQLSEGRAADDRHPGAVADAEVAFTLLRNGLRKL